MQNSRSPSTGDQGNAQRIEYLTVDVKNLEDLLAKGYTTRRNLEERRRELDRCAAAPGGHPKRDSEVASQKTDLETQRGRETRRSEFALNEARRQMDATAEQLNQNTQVISPIDGRVLEVKISRRLGACRRHAGDRDRKRRRQARSPRLHSGRTRQNVKPGMQVRLEPSTVKREEFGTMIGTVVTISDFPITPQGMAAVLHNDNLVTRFTHDGAAYAATVSLEQDADDRQRLSLGRRTKGRPFVSPAGR